MEISSNQLSVRGTLHGMGRKERCELLLERKPVSPLDALTGIRQAQTEWTLLRAPLDLPDGEYTVTSADGHHFRATRSKGFWMHQESVEPPRTAPMTVFSGAAFPPKLRSIAAAILQFDDRYGVSVLFLAALITYGLPTVVELMAARDLHLGIAVVLFGDVIGCVCLVTFLEMPVFGVALYILLTLCEGWLYFTHDISVGHLVWFVDLVPACVVALRIARLRSVAHPSPARR